MSVTRGGQASSSLADEASTMVAIAFVSVPVVRSKVFVVVVEISASVLRSLTVSTLLSIYGSHYR